MSVARFDALLAILEPHIKKTTNFSKLGVQGSIYSALCCEIKWMNLTIAILDFAVRLYGGSELSKRLSKCEKCKTKIEPIQIFLWRMKISEAVCKCDWHNVRSCLFFNVRTFRTEISDSMCNDLWIYCGYCTTRLHLSLFCGDSLMYVLIN